MVKYSVFAPIFNESGNIIPLYREVSRVMDKLGDSWEFILVNDGSRDGSLSELKSLKNVTIVDLKKNYGQSVAMDAGFRVARGEFVITLDADLQNDPADIPRMLEKLAKEKLDVVCGWRAKRKDPAWMIAVTLTARVLRGFFANDGIHDSGCTLRVYRASYVRDLELWGEMHRYIVAILRWQGARVGELRVNHRPRIHGVTKYTVYKSVKGFVDLFYIWFWKKFSSRPLHLFGVAGLGCMFLGGLSGLWTVYLKLAHHVSLSDSVWFMMSAFLCMIGLQFFTTGIMLDLLIRNYFNGSREKRYEVKEIIKR